MRIAKYLIYVLILLFSKSLYSYDVDIKLKASIKRMITTKEITQLSFGESMITSNAGFIQIPPSLKEGVVVGGGHQYIKGASAGRIKVLGEKDSQVLVSISPSGVMQDDKGNSLDVDYKTKDNNLVLDNKGEAEIITHGTLNIKPNTKTGFYKGTYIIKLEY